MGVIECQRKTLRLQGYDYSRSGYYFVTICTFEKIQFFGDIVDGKMCLNKMGIIVKQCWLNIPEHFYNSELDKFVIMPNHIHGIIKINDHNDNVGGADLRPLQRPLQYCNCTKMLLPKIVHGFKSSATRIIRQQKINTIFQWQRSYHDHIIRNEHSLHQIRQYIMDNPMKWESDEYNVS